VTSLIRHFSDLRDGVHGGATSRRDKEARFADEVDLLAPVATNALAEVNTYLLLDSERSIRVESGRNTKASLPMLAASIGAISSSWHGQSRRGIWPFV
jgi:hypothetical protein